MLVGLGSLISGALLGLTTGALRGLGARDGLSFVFCTRRCAGGAFEGGVGCLVARGLSFVFLTRRCAGGGFDGGVGCLVAGIDPIKQI